MGRQKNGFSALVTLLVIAIIIALGTAGWFFYQSTKQDGNAGETVSSFEECVAAGYPVAESYPRQCHTPGGQSFTEDVNGQNEPQTPLTEYTSPKGEVIRMDAPLENQTVTSPLKISGEVRGNWSFEATFPIELQDLQGNIIAEGHATLDGDWMTENYVPFNATLTFSKPSASEGVLILQKDNPSGLPKNDDAVEIPVKF
jgi:hypothetical protein